MLNRTQNHAKWIHFVKNILSNLCLKHVWQNQSTFSLICLKLKLKSELQQQYENYWKTQTRWQAIQMCSQSLMTFDLWVTLTSKVIHSMTKP